MRIHHSMVVVDVEQRVIDDDEEQPMVDWVAELRTEV